MNYRMAYYNEIDPKAAAWLRQLINDGRIADGVVDERSIIDVEPREVKEFTQCHWFAGIGGWSYALRLAGIPDDYPVWTASLPCQPFSVAGLCKGKQDERHLLPHYLELVRQCKPNIQFGEQVEGAIRHGWIDDLQTTMEAEGYAVGHCVLGAHSVGSFHQRQRLYWVANSNRERLQRRALLPECADKLASWSRCMDGAMVDTDGDRCESRGETTKEARYRSAVESAGWSNPYWIECRDNKYRPIKPGLEPLVDGLSRGVVRSGNPNSNATARAMRLKGYGNAIVPQVAAEFIGAAITCIYESNL